LFTNLISNNIKGSHEELTKDPEGAYSQLIRLQGGAMDSEESQDIDADMSRSSLDRDRSISSPRSQKHSVQGSISRGSSGSRRSFTLNTVGFGMPGPTSVHDDEFEQNNERNVKPKEVSIKRLAYLNKPELPVLFLGTVAAVIHGVIFPVFGLLLSKAINMFYEPPKEIRKDSKFWAVLYLGLGFITFAALPLQYYLFGIAGGKLIERIRSKTFEKVVHQEISWFDDPTNSRCVEDILILPIHVTALEIYKEIKKRYYYSQI
jgi:ATP-binding cassette subfamily B (MDR/TAP) protein 1